MSKYITEAGNYYDKFIKGSDIDQMQNDVALIVNAKGNVHFKTLEIWDCGLPLVHTGGSLRIEKLKCQEFSADLLNSCGGLHIDELEVYYDYDFNYSDNYHVDALGQFFTNKGSCDDVYIGKITATIIGKNVQGMILSETCNYDNFSIGSKGCDIAMEYPYAFVANTLENSYINVGNNGIKIKKVKLTPNASGNNWIERPGNVLIYNKQGDIVL